MGFLKLENKNYLIFGIANKKSVAYHISKILLQEGAKVIASVQTEKHKEKVKKILPEVETFICDVEKEEDIVKLASAIKNQDIMLDGIVHSLAFANFSEGLKSFHETLKKDFLQAVDISAFSLMSIANNFKNLLHNDASVVTISISTTSMAAESYGYMAPVKAALDSMVCFLAKSFSNFSNIRFNSIKAGLLKTSASAGIPGYIDYYLYAEQLTLRKAAIKTEEVANTATFLLSEKSAGINAQGIIVDCGMAVNYFDKDVVQKFSKGHILK